MILSFNLLNGIAETNSIISIKIDSTQKLHLTKQIRDSLLTIGFFFEFNLIIADYDCFSHFLFIRLLFDGNIQTANVNTMRFVWCLQVTV